MARMGGDRGDGDGERRGASSPLDSAPRSCPVLEKGKRREPAPGSPSSGVFERVLPTGKAPTADNPPGRGVAGPVRASRHAGHPERVSVDSGSSMGRAILRLFGAGAAGVMLVPPTLDGAETADLGGEVAVEFHAVSAEVVAGLLPRQLLLDIRAVSGRPGLFALGQRVRFRGNAQLLLDYLLGCPRVQR